MTEVLGMVAALAAIFVLAPDVLNHPHGRYLLLRLTIGISLLLAAVSLGLFLINDEPAGALTVGVLGCAIGWAGGILLEQRLSSASPPGSPDPAWKVGVKWVGVLCAFLALVFRILGA